MKNKCKGCGREFFTTNPTVKFCLNECRKIANRIESAEKYIVLLREQQNHIFIHGKARSEENLRRKSSDCSDPYAVPAESG